MQAIVTYSGENRQQEVIPGVKSVEVVNGAVVLADAYGVRIITAKAYDSIIFR